MMWLKNFCGVGNVLVDAARVLKRMPDLGVQPHVQTWDLVVRGVCTQIMTQGQKEDKILELLKHRFLYYIMNFLLGFFKSIYIS